MNFAMRSYCWVHVRTGKTGTREFKEKYKGHLLEMCDKWNRQGEGAWVYWTL